MSEKPSTQDASADDLFDDDVVLEEDDFDGGSEDDATGRVESPSGHVSLRRGRRPNPSSPEDAELHERAVVPQWRALFGKPILDRIEPGFRGRVLDVAAGTGYPSIEIVRLMADSGRVIAIEEDAGLLSVLRRRASDFAGRRLFARAESAHALSFGDEVFDLVVACSGASAPWTERDVIAEFRRVLVPGGRVLLGLPLRGTFEEVFDMFRDVATRLDDKPTLHRVEALAHRAPMAEHVALAFQAGGFRDVVCAYEERHLIFRSVAELFSSPVTRVVGLPDWRAACGFGRESGELMAEIERTFATYVPRGPVTLKVCVGLLEAVRE